MGPELVFGRTGISTDASGSKETASIMDEQKDKYTRCTSNCQDNTFEMEAAGDEEDGRSQDVEVDILHSTNPGNVGLLKPPCQDLTENSSSFADSISGDEDAMRLSEGEVQSQFHGDAPSVLPFDEYSEIFRIRKKRLTPHWRTFIRPIQWRCKWLELQIKKCQAEAMKYDREIAAYTKKKLSEAEKYTLEGFSAKSHPFSSQARGVMKRKKRKRFEETADIASYMGRHNLFSYYERSAHSASLSTDNLGNREKRVDGNGGAEVDNELLSHEFRDNQNMMELILGKIEKVHSRVSTMKTSLNKIMSGHAESFIDGNRFVAPCYALASVARSPATPCDSGERKFLESTCAATQHISKDSLGHGKMSPAGIVNSRDNSKVTSPVHIADGMLMYRRRTKPEVDDGMERFPVQLTERSLVVKTEQHSSLTPTSLPVEADDDQPAPKIRSLSNLAVTNNRRKGSRGRGMPARSKP